MAGERRDDDATLRLRYDLRQLLADFGLRRREVGVLGVGGVAHHEVDADFAELRQRAEVGGHAVDGGLIELEVARVQHVSGRALEEHAHGARDGMVHGEELGREAAQLDLVARFDLDELGVLDLMLGELALDEAQRHLRAVDGHVAIEVLHEVREGSRVVLVAVRDDDAAQLVGVLQHVGVVGQDEIDARMVVVGKHQASVVEDHVAFALEHRHVLADGVETAQRDDLERGVRILLRRGEVASRALVAAVGRSALTALPRLRQLRALVLELHVLVRASLLVALAVLVSVRAGRFLSPARAPAGAVLRTCAIASALDARVLLFHRSFFLRRRGRMHEEPGIPAGLAAG